MQSNNKIYIEILCIGGKIHSDKIEKVNASIIRMLLKYLYTVVRCVKVK